MTSINIRKLSHSEMDLYRKPLLPEKWSCFPVDRDIDTQQLRKILQKDLDKIRSGAEKDPFSKLPSDLLSMVDEICGQLPRLPANTARKTAVRLQPMLQTLDQIIKKLEARNSDPIKSDKQFVNKAVKRYRQVQTTRKLL